MDRAQVCVPPGAMVASAEKKTGGSVDVASGSVRVGIGMEGNAVGVLFPVAADPQETMKTARNKGIRDLMKAVEVVISAPLYSNHHRVGLKTDSVLRPTRSAEDANRVQLPFEIIKKHHPRRERIRKNHGAAV
jgi:hypothetical protein